MTSTAPRSDELAERIAELGPRMGTDVRDATSALFAPLHPAHLSYEVKRDLHYGEDPLQVLDLHLPPGERETLRPVFCYVHGGGFTGGDKSKPGLPFYDNIGRFAVESGWVGVNLNYRLAPANPYPSGAKDVAAALGFVAEHIAEHGGDPNAVIVMGHSAGAAHVASAIAHFGVGSPREHPTAGAILSSGLYDPTLKDEDYAAYFGDEPVRKVAAIAVDGVVESTIPLLVSMAQFDPPEVQRQSHRLLEAYFAAHDRFPELVQADGHNHFSVVMQIATNDRWFSDRLSRFVERLLANR